MRVGQKIQMLQTYIKIIEVFKQYPHIGGLWIKKQQACKMDRNWGGEEVIGIRTKVARQQDK